MTLDKNNQSTNYCAQSPLTSPVQATTKTALGLVMMPCIGVSIKVQYKKLRFSDFVPLFFVLVQNAKKNSTKVIEFSLLVQRFFGLVQNYVPIIIGTKSSSG